MKQFFRISVESIFLQLICIAAICSSIYFSIIYIKGVLSNSIESKFINIFIIAILILGSILFAYVEITFWVGNIVLDKKSIYCHGDIRIGQEKIQYFKRVDYCDIKSVSIEAFRTNSNGKSIRINRPIPYLVIRDNKEKKYMFALHFMSRKSVKNLLNNLKMQAEKFGNLSIDVECLLTNFDSCRFKVN